MRWRAASGTTKTDFGTFFFTFSFFSLVECGVLAEGGSEVPVHRIYHVESRS